jgi:hypothetical protein
MVMASDTSSEHRSEIYTDFDEFLKAAIHEYYRGAGKKNKAAFIALVIASGEVTSLALDSLKSGEGMKKLAIGAVGVVALRLGLKYALGGPLGILLAGASLASLVAYFMRNRKEITGRIGRYRELVAEVRLSYDKLQSDHRDGRLDETQRNLMIDGLTKRFLDDL